LIRGWLTRITLVEPCVTLLPDNAAESLAHALLLVAVGRDVHLALDGDVRVGDGGGKELAEGAEKEGNGGRHLALLLDRILHLLEERVLKDGVDDEHQGRDDAGEEGLGPLVLEEGHEGSDGARGLLGPGDGAALDVGLFFLLAGGDASVDDPYGVGDDDGRGAGKGAGQHGLDGGELLAGATSLCGGLLKRGPGPLVPVVVHKVGDADAEESRVDARVKAGDALAGDNLLDSLDKLALGLFGLDLGAGRECDERVPEIRLADPARCIKGWDGRLVREDHGQEAAASTGEGVGDIVVHGKGGLGSRHVVGIR
jgi:hypothetical protein